MNHEQSHEQSQEQLHRRMVGLENEIALVEKRIYEMESRYLRDSQQHGRGNIMEGYLVPTHLPGTPTGPRQGPAAASSSAYGGGEGSLSSSARVAQGSARKGRVEKSLMIFSLSSVTSPVYRQLSS